MVRKGSTVRVRHWAWVGPPGAALGPSVRRRHVPATREVYFHGVFERFSERARRVVSLAQDEARALRHDYIGTEHILLGLGREDEGLAARVLESLDVTVDGVRAAVVRIVGLGEEVVGSRIPFTPRAKKVLAVAVSEARSQGNSDVQTEHILLALVGENEGVAARILLDFGAGLQTVRDEVMRMLPPKPDAGSLVSKQPPWRVASGVSGEMPAIEPSQPRTLFGWRSRSMALAALGATSLGRRAFGPRRGQPDGLALELLVAVALADGDQDARADLDRLLSALSSDTEGFSAVEALLSANLVQPRGLLDPAVEDEDGEEKASLILTDEGAAVVRSWLKRVSPLFARWPPQRSDVDDAH